MEDTVKMVHKDNPKQTVEVRNQIQRDAFTKQGFVDAEKQDKDHTGNLPADVVEERKFAAVTEDVKGNEDNKKDQKVDVKKGNK